LLLRLTFKFSLSLLLSIAKKAEFYTKSNNPKKTADKGGSTLYRQPQRMLLNPVVVLSRDAEKCIGIFIVL
jgi:hypothetical protein